MAIMEKKEFLGVQKKRVPTKRTKKKKYLPNKVVEYLKSDCYLFAPLTSSKRSDFRSHKIEIKELKKILLNKVGHYLMSDSYMYAPLVNVSPKPQHVQTKGPQRYTKHVTVEVSMRSISLKENTKLANEIVQDKVSKDRLPEKLIPDRPSSIHKETVKRHAVYQNCRSLSEKGMHSSRLRKLC